MKLITVLVAAAFSSWAEAPDRREHSPAATAGFALQDSTALQLIDRWIQAMGGMESYARLQSASYTLTTELYEPLTGRLRRARPRYVTLARLDSGESARIERWEGNDFIQQGWDGERAWATLNGEALTEGDKDFDETSYVGGDVFYWIGLPFKLKDVGVHASYRGTDDEGRHLVEVTFGEGVGEHDGDTWYYVFEEGQSVPVSIGYREEGREQVNRTYWEDIQEVDGYVFAGKRVHINQDGNVWKILRTSDFVLNPEAPPELFRQSGQEDADGAEAAR